jgi:FdhD protein
MDRMLKKVKIIKVGQAAQSQEDLVAVDSKMELSINQQKVGDFYLSPHDLKEFALGYLFDERYIKSLADVKEIKIEPSLIKVFLKDGPFLDQENLGCYDGWFHQEQLIPTIESDYKVDREEIFQSFDKLLEKARVWSQTGGTHVAAIVGQGHFIVREDVSRHVAIDKVIGAGLMSHMDFSNSFIVCSGRIPPDRVVKLANVGIPIMITKAAPTVEGIRIGEKAGITLIGFLREGRFNIYTHPHRVLF